MYVPTNTRLALPADLPLIRQLQRKHTEALGHIPTSEVARRVAHALGVVAIENGEPAGFMLLYRPTRPGNIILPIHQAAIALDAQRRHNGLALVAHAVRTAEQEARQIVQCWCRATLPANLFWREAGFQPTHVRPGGRRRGQPIILWRRWTCATGEPWMHLQTAPRRSGAASPVRSDIHTLAPAHVAAIAAATGETLGYVVRSILADFPANSVRTAEHPD